MRETLIRDLIWAATASEQPIKKIINEAATTLARQQTLIKQQKKLLSQLLQNNTLTRFNRHAKNTINNS